MVPAPEPGMYYDVPFDEYIAWQAVNNSSLSHAARSMAHYRYAPQIKRTDALRFGSLVHCGHLEPAAIGMRYAVMPDFKIRRDDGTEYANVKASKAYKEAVAEWTDRNREKEVVTAEEFDRMLEMVESLTRHDRARQWLKDGHVEVSLVWDDVDSGIRCKARIDRVNEHGLFDLKTTQDGSRFDTSLARYSYHRQAAFYKDGWASLAGGSWRFGIVAIEKEAPYAVRAAYVSEEAIAVGRDEYRRLLRALAQSRRTNQWPAYDDPDEWTLPAWAFPDVQLTLHGEAIG